LSISLTPPIARVLQLHVVPELVAVLDGDNTDEIKLEAAWALTNIASGTCEQTAEVVKAGGIEQFVRLLESDDPALREQAVWGLGNIAGDLTTFRDAILAKNGMELILQQLDYPDISKNMLHTVTWTISNLCRGKKPPPPFNIVSKALPYLARLIHSSDHEVQADACWALSYLSDEDKKTEPSDKIERVLNSNVVGRLVELMMSPKLSVRTPALRTIGNLVTGTNQQTQVVLNHNVLRALLHLLQDGTANIQQEACWAISNITAGSKSQIEQVAQANLFGVLVAKMRGSIKDIQKEAAWAIANACYGGTSEHIKQIVQAGAIPAIIEMLRDPDDERVTQIILEALRLILNAGADEARLMKTTNPYAVIVHHAEGGAVLEKLLEHPSPHINRRAYDLAVKFFQVQTADDETTEDTGEIQF